MRVSSVPSCFCFGRNAYYNCPILKGTGTTGTFTGNVWDDTGAAVGIQTHD